MCGKTILVNNGWTKNSSEADRKQQPEIRVLLGEVEDLHARHAAAERAASEAFDRLWSAKEQYVGNVGN